MNNFVDTTLIKTRKSSVLICEAVLPPISNHRSLPLCFTKSRAPTTADFDYELFSVWRDSTTFKLYMLSDRKDKIANWNNIVEQTPDAQYITEFLDQSAVFRSAQTIDNKLIFSDDKNLFFNLGVSNEIKIGTTADPSRLRINDSSEIVHGDKNYLNFVPISPFQITQIGPSDYAFNYSLPLNVLRTIICDVSAAEPVNHNVFILGNGGLQTEGVSQDTLRIGADPSHVIIFTFNQSNSYTINTAILLNNIVYVAKTNISSGSAFNASGWRNLNQSVQTLSADDDQLVPISADGNIKILGTEKIGNNLSVKAQNIKIFDAFGAELIPVANNVFVKESLTSENRGLGITMNNEVMLIRPDFNIRQTSIVAYDILDIGKFEIFSNVDQKHSLKEGSGILFTEENGKLRIDAIGGGGGTSRVWKDEFGATVLKDGFDTSFIFGSPSKGISVNAISDRFQIDVTENIRRVGINLINSIGNPLATVFYNPEQILTIRNSDSISFDTFSPNEVTATTQALLKFDIPNNAVFTQNNAIGLTSDQSTIAITSVTAGILNLDILNPTASAKTIGFDRFGVEKFSQSFVDGNLLLQDTENAQFELVSNKVTVETSGGGAVDTETLTPKNGILEPIVVSLSINGRSVQIGAFTASIKGVKTSINAGSISANDVSPSSNLKQFYLTYNPELSNFQWSSGTIAFVLTERILLGIYFISTTEIILLNQNSSIHNNMNQTYSELCSAMPYVVSNALLTFNAGLYKIKLAYTHLYLISAQDLELEIPTLNRVIYNGVTKEFEPFVAIIGNTFTVSMVMFSILENDIYEVFFTNISLENPSLAIAIGIDIFTKEKLQIFNCFISISWILYHGAQAVQFVGINENGVALLTSSITCDEGVTYLG